MTPSQHARFIFSQLKQAGMDKYMRGQKEHSGKLWKIPILTLIGFAQEEVLDQGSYLWTLQGQLVELRGLCLQLFESLESSEEPPLGEESLIIKQIRELLGVK